MMQNEFSDCKAAERGDAVASLSEANAADGNPGLIYPVLKLVLHIFQKLHSLFLLLYIISDAIYIIFQK
jgi:hypothetical protein